MEDTTKCFMISFKKKLRIEENDQEETELFFLDLSVPAFM